MLLTKSKTEKIIAQAGQTVNNYQGNNEIFVDDGFFNSINKKYQKLTSFGVGAHYQNVIIENRNKVLTTGARTLFLHRIRMWLQMIDEIFWPFEIKSVAERMNSLQIYLKGRMIESIFYGTEVEEIPLKYFHTLFFPIDMLDAHI